MSLSLCLSVSLSLSDSVSVCLPVSPSPPLSLSPSLPLSLSPSPPISLSLLCIASDDDISVRYCPCVLLVGEILVQFNSAHIGLASPAVDTEDDRGRSIRKAMAEIVIMLICV